MNMTKKQTIDEVVAELNETPTSEPSAYDIARETRWARESALDKALEHHKINGGMLTPDQLIDNARKFHTYITGETK